MKILICGDRNWSNKNIVKSTIISIQKHAKIDLIIEGEARGADSIAREVAEELNIPVSKFPADWEKYGRAAGPIRNRQMLKEDPDLIIAFHDDIHHSRGTKDMCEIARQKEKKVILINSSGKIEEIKNKLIL